MRIIERLDGLGLLRIRLGKSVDDFRGKLKLSREDRVASLGRLSLPV